MNEDAQRRVKPKAFLLSSLATIEAEVSFPLLKKWSMTFSPIYASAALTIIDNCCAPSSAAFRKPFFLH